MTTAIYHLAGLSNLTFGHQLPSQHFPPQLNLSVKPNSTGWSIPAGAFTAREIVHYASPLFDSIVYRLGNGVHSSETREALIEGFALSLSTSGRESSLPLPATALDNSRKELYSQAQRIGETLTQYVRETEIAATDPEIRIRSHCDGHLWSPPLVALLTGPRGGSDVMMLQNEWLHQMILLRDALLPFENFEEVKLVQTAKHGGMRGFEKARKLFLAELMTGKVPQSAIVELAMAQTTSTLVAEGGYGFQYEHGVVLPASLDIGASRSLYLLRYHSARIDESQTELLFEYEYPAYFEATRSEVPDAAQTLLENTWPPPQSNVLDATAHDAAILVQPGSSDSSRILSLQLSFQETCTRVDLGQIARGQRFAYHPQPAVSTATGLSVAAALHIPKDILLRPGLVTSEGGVHVIPADSQLVVMALLGKIYPENVVLMEREDQPEMAEVVGKGFGTRFIIWKGYE